MNVFEALVVPADWRKVLFVTQNVDAECYWE